MTSQQKNYTSDFIDDDDDGEDQVQEGRGAEDWIPESTGTAVLHAGCPRRSRRTLFVFALRAPKLRLPNVSRRWKNEWMPMTTEMTTLHRTSLLAWLHIEHTHKYIH